MYHLNFLGFKVCEEQNVFTFAWDYKVPPPPIMQMMN